MAQSGTLVQLPTGYGYWTTQITGITTATDSPVFNLRGYMYTSYDVHGTFGAAGTCQWQGSNDGGTTWVNIGSSFTSAQGGTLTPSQVPYELYRLHVTSGDATTSLSAYIVASGSRG